MKYFLSWIVVAFSAGIVFGNWIKVNFLIFYFWIIFILSTAIYFYRKERLFIILSIFLMFFLGWLWMLNSLYLAKNHILYVFGNGPPKLCKITGFIITDPDIRNYRTSFIFRTEEIECHQAKKKIQGDILVFSKQKLGLDYGQELILSGKLNKINSNRYKRGSLKYQQYLHRRKIYYILFVKNKSNCICLDLKRGGFFKKLALGFKRHLERLLYDKFSPVCAGILDAMILGEKRNIPSGVYNAMVKTGTVHILVVSGFNVGIVSFLFHFLLKILRIGRLFRFFCVALLLILYCILTGGATPVVRATIMAISLQAGYFLKREQDILNSCSLAALIILLINPAYLFDIGFELSFVCVLSLGWLYPKVRSILKLEGIRHLFIRYPIENLVLSFSVWLGTAGFIAYHFRMVSPVTILANIFIPAVASLITICGLAMIMLNYLSSYISLSFVPVCESLIAVLLNFNSFLLAIPNACFYLGSP